MLVATYGGLRFGELAGLRRKRVDVLSGRKSVQETLSDVNGELSFGEPKTKRSRRTVPLPRSIVRELEAHLARYPNRGPTPWSSPGIEERRYDTPDFGVCGGSQRR